MKKIIFTLTALCLGVSAFAGGYFQNTSQSVMFLRQPARNATIGVEGAYYNPAGVGFMNNGWHLAIDWQFATQKKLVNSTYSPFALGVDHLGATEVDYTGKISAPFIPHLDLAYNHDKFFASMHIGYATGGGKCSFNDGLGCYEAPVAAVTSLLYGLTQGAVSGYDADIHVIGSQMNYSAQFNFGYKVTDHFSAALGLRLNYLVNKYDIAIKDFMFNYGGNMVSGATLFTALGAMNPALAGFGSALSDRVVDAKNTGFGVTPIISVDYKNGKWNLAARYEIRTKVTLKNSTETNTSGFSFFNDGQEVRADIPASLSLGAGYEILPQLRASAAFNYYFDKKAEFFNMDTNSNDGQNAMAGNTWEAAGGIEWDYNDKLTLSCGVNYTRFNLGDTFINDTNFNTNATTLCFGGRYRINDRIAIDAALCTSLYGKYTKHYADYSGLKSYESYAQYFANVDTSADVTYHRKSFSGAIGVVFDF